MTPTAPLGLALRKVFRGGIWASSSGDGVELTSDSPYPGLASFEEKHREFFFGRQREIDDLRTLVERQPVTILSGASGLGKTSLIAAGLFPLLRTSGFFPVSVRLAFSEDAKSLVPSLMKQFTTAMHPELVDYELESPYELVQREGEGGVLPSEATISDPPSGETLWEFFHRLSIWNKKSRRLLPVIVFDQFEELFTIGRNHPGSRALIAEIGDLVGNYIPQTVVPALASMAYRFPYKHERLAAKVIIVIREDWLADLDDVANRYPELSVRRYRLTRLRGTNAVLAVRGSNAHLVSESVAESIVRRATGNQEDENARAPLDEIEAEPAILSLYCHALNLRRLADRRSLIDEELVRIHGSKILPEFYRGATHDVPRRGRTMISKLLNENGFRKSLSVGEAQKLVNQAWIDELVRRRLLRFEERFGERHVELIHDVLAKTVREVKRERDRKRARRTGVSAALMILALLSSGGVHKYRSSVAAQAARSRAGTLLEQFTDDMPLAQCRQLYRELERIQTSLGGNTRAEATRKLKLCDEAADALAQQLETKAKAQRDRRDWEQALLLLVKAEVVRARDELNRSLYDELQTRVYRPGLRLTLRGHSRPPRVTLFDDQSGRVFSASSTELNMWGLQTDASERVLAAEGSEFRHVSRAPDGAALVTQRGAHASSIALYAEGRLGPTCLWEARTPNLEAVTSYLIGDDELITTYPALALWKLGGRQAVAEASPCPTRSLISMANLALPSNVTWSSQSRDGRYFVVGGVGADAYVWSAARPGEIRRLGSGLQGERALSGAFDSEVRRVALGFSNGQVLLFSAKLESSPSIVRTIAGCSIVGLAFCRNEGREQLLIAARSPGGTDANSGITRLFERDSSFIDEGVARVTLGEPQVRSLDASPDCSTIVSGWDDGTVRISDVTSAPIPPNPGAVARDLSRRLGLTNPDLSLNSASELVRSLPQ